MFASAYAAFSTSLNINAKGNLIEKENIIIGGKKVYLMTSGDGLYVDSVEDGRYVYAGTNPDNYICLEQNGTCLHDNLYRIIAVESDQSLKIIKNETIGQRIYDYSGTSARISAYCSYSSTAGCKIWGSKHTILDENGNNITHMQIDLNDSKTYELPDTEADLNVYLNNN